MYTKKNGKKNQKESLKYLSFNLGQLGSTDRVALVN